MYGAEAGISNRSSRNRWWLKGMRVRLAGLITTDRSQQDRLFEEAELEHYGAGLQRMDGAAIALDTGQRCIVMGDDLRGRRMGFVLGGMGVADQRDLITQARGAAHGGVDAVFRGVSAHHDMGNVGVAEYGFELSVKEGIRSGLGDDVVAFGDGQPSVERPFRAAVSEEVAGGGFVLHEYHGSALLPGTLGQGVDPFDDLRGGSRGGGGVEQGVLYVDDDKRFHGYQVL